MRRLCLLLAAISISGCTSQTGPDANTDVFKTPEEAGAHRRQRLMSDWADLAARIANAERPDVRTIKAPQGFGLLASADGVERRIDLSPLTEQLTSSQGKERDVIRSYLARELPALDRDRLVKMGFERARPLLWPQLANSKQLSEMGVAGRKEPPIAQRVVVDLYAVPVARWPGSDARTALDSGVASAWKVSDDEVIAAARGNLKSSVAEGGLAFETVDLPGMGRYGSLRGSSDAAVVLLPEFLAQVRKQWNTTDDLILFMPSRSSVTFTESKNTRLLERMVPEWSKLYASVSEPLIPTMVVAGDKGLSLSNYRPATKPSTAPATRPGVRPVAPAGPIGPFGT
jgi:hypothetical protein